MSDTDDLAARHKPITDEYRTEIMRLWMIDDVAERRVLATVSGSAVVLDLLAEIDSLRVRVRSDRTTQPCDCTYPGTEIGGRCGRCGGLRADRTTQPADDLLDRLQANHPWPTATNPYAASP